MQQMRFINTEGVEGRKSENMLSSQNSNANRTPNGRRPGQESDKTCKGQQKQSLYSEVNDFSGPKWPCKVPGRQKLCKGHQKTAFR